MPWTSWFFGRGGKALIQSLELSTRRSFLRTAAMVASASTLLRWQNAWAVDAIDPKVAAIVEKSIGIDTHNHIDVPMTAAELPGPDLDLMGEMKRSGLSAICMTFATDYQPGDPYDRFHTALGAMDRQLARNEIRRALTPADVLTAHKAGRPAVIQAIEGAHFLEGYLERVQEAYGRGLRHFGLLHDSDASVPLGDVYTNKPQFGGLTAFGSSVIKECNRLGMVLDLAHADMQTTKMALKVSTRPVIVSHTGLDTQLGGDSRMAQMMRPRLIGKEQARMIADQGGAIGVWTHLEDTPRDYAKNIRALVDVIGVEHVCLGTDTKLTQPSPRGFRPPPGGRSPDGHGPEGGPPLGAMSQAGGPPHEGSDNAGAGGPQRARAGERTNQVWSSDSPGFYYVVVDAMLKAGFHPDEIGKIGGGNYLRIFGEATER